MESNRKTDLKKIYKPRVLNNEEYKFYKNQNFMKISKQGMYI